MPVKWKIFYALNIVTGLLSFIALLAMVLSSTDPDQTAQDYMFLGIFLFTFLIMAVNSFLNIALLHRYYPDKLLPRGIKVLANWLFILMILITVVFLLGGIVTVITELSGSEKNISGNAGMIGLSFLGVVTILQIIIVIMQKQLTGQIRRNYEKSMHSLIESIGQTPEKEN
jgi:hypothetical protein